MWVAQDGYFWIITAVFGMCVVDCWNAYKHHLPQKHRHKDCDLMSMVNVMAKDLLDNKENNTIEVDSSSLCIAVGLVRNVATSPSSASKVSQLTGKYSATASELKDLKLPLQVESHMMVPFNDQTDAKRKGGNKRTGREILKMRKRTKRGDCFECKRMSNIKIKRVKYYCPECVAPFNCKYYWLCHDCLPDHRSRIYNELIAST